MGTLARSWRHSPLLTTLSSRLSLLTDMAIGFKFKACGCLMTLRTREIAARSWCAVRARESHEMHWLRCKDVVLVFPSLPFPHAIERSGKGRVGGRKIDFCNYRLQFRPKSIM